MHHGNPTGLIHTQGVGTMHQCRVKVNKVQLDIKSNPSYGNVEKMVSKNIVAVYFHYSSCASEPNVV